MLFGSLVASIACSETGRIFSSDQEDSGTEPDDDDDDAGVGPDGGIEMSCAEAEDCDDGNSCNGEEECTKNVCQAGDTVDDGESCELAGEEGNLFCVSGNCSPSRCGDGVVDEDADEECDDGNQELGDCCEEKCTFTCDSEGDCDDSNVCNGDETCDDKTHICVAGTELDKGANCGMERECNLGRCVTEGCGNGIVSGTEQCDDANEDDTDGCRTDCRFTCEVDEQCNDGNACTGAESCDTESHTCKAGEAVVCDSKDDCVETSCNPESGKCVSRLKDADEDGHAPTSLGECGTDCDDKDKSIYEGAEELCDGKDNDCDGKTDETAPSWYVDCDGDGCAGEKLFSVTQCELPSSATAYCAIGQAAAWTSTAPDKGTTDCFDASSAVRPMSVKESNSAWTTTPISGQSDGSLDFDYNCDTDEELRYTTNAKTTDKCGLVFEPFAVPSTSDNYQSQGIFQVCPGSAGYTGRVPDCGKSAEYTYCLGNCKRLTTGRTQQCR